MFIAALFTIARLWNQPRCPQLVNGLKKYMVYVHNGVLFIHKE
jgi:hypothetical protein